MDGFMRHYGILHDALAVNAMWKVHPVGIILLNDKPELLRGSPQVISLCPDNRLLDNLRECNKLLEQVQKGLSEYLETKRNAFQRFYFLSVTSTSFD